MADFSAITSGIGQGKTLWAVMNIARTLEETDRLIITDIPLVFELKTPVRTLWTWAEYCQKFIKRPIDVSKRLAVLDFDTGTEFWRYLPAAAYPEEYIEKWLNHEDPERRIEIVTVEWAYGKNRLIKLPNKKNVRFGQVPNFEFRTSDMCAMRGVDYWKDEAHKSYPPMYYQKVGAQADWYITEMRRLDDNASWISQHPEKVDKNFRRLTTEWWQVQNMAKTPLFLGVTVGKRFRFHWYCQPEMPTRLDKPTSSGWYRLDPSKRLHDLYDTMATSSMMGNSLVLHGEKHKGRSPVVWAYAALAVLLAAIVIPRVLDYGMTWISQAVAGAGLHGIRTGVTRAVGNTVASPPVQTSNPVTGAVHPKRIDSNFATVRQGEVNPVRLPDSAPPADWSGVSVTGTSLSPSGVNVFLSNGLMLDTNDVLDIGKRWVRLRDGTKLPIAGRTPQAVEPPVPYQVPQAFRPPWVHN
ncbi:MAG TPA: hypothetical protein VGI03_11670 [Verrucomicrobiae bacterium]|jgi:hypothetical protein